MAIKEILDKIAGKLPDDAGNELMSLIADAKREANTILADLSAANNESKERRLKLSEMNSENEALKAKLADATKANPEIDSLKEKAAKYDELIKSKEAETLKQWQDKYAEIQKIASNDADKRKDKIKALLADFQIPAEGETLTAEAAAANLKLYSIAEKAGAFAEPQETTHTNFQQRSNPAGSESPKTSGDAVLNIIKSK